MLICSVVFQISLLGSVCFYCNSWGQPIVYNKLCANCMRLVEDTHTTGYLSNVLISPWPPSRWINMQLLFAVSSSVWWGRCMCECLGAASGGFIREVHNRVQQLPSPPNQALFYSSQKAQRRQTQNHSVRFSAFLLRGITQELELNNTQAKQRHW